MLTKKVCYFQTVSPPPEQAPILKKLLMDQSNIRKTEATQEHQSAMLRPTCTFTSTHPTMVGKILLITASTNDKIWTNYNFA